MTIKINVSLLEKNIPIDYRRLILHLIKSVIEKEDKSLFDKYYSDTSKKPFTFWTKLIGAKFFENYISLEKNEITFCISTNNTKLAFVLYNGFKSIRKTSFEIGKTNKLFIENVKVIGEKEIVDNEIIINMLSPLVIRKHVKGEKDKYFLFNEDGFNEQFLYATENKIEIEAVKCRKVIVKAYGTNIPSTLGIFKVKGDINSLKNAYLCGLGSKTSAGFGKFDIIG